MKKPSIPAQWAFLAVLPLALYLVAMLVDVWQVRVPYPYDLEWMEGGVLAHAWRILHFKGVYIEPNADWIPMIYPPGVAATVAFLGIPFGITPFLGRSLALGAALLAGAAIVYAAWDHDGADVRRKAPMTRTESIALFIVCGMGIAAVFGASALPRPDLVKIGAPLLVLLIAGLAALRAQGRRIDGLLIGLAGAAIFWGTYPNSGAFMDLVRPDSFFVAAVAWAVIVTTMDNEDAPKWAGILIFIAFVYKQNAALFGVPISLAWWARRGWRSGLRFGLWAAIPAIAYLIFMQVISGGHFLEWLLDVAASHQMHNNRLFPGSMRETGNAMPIALVFTSLAVALYGPRLTQKLSTPVMVLLPIVAGAGMMGVDYAIGHIDGIARSEMPNRMAGAFALGCGAGAFLLGAAVQLWERRFQWKWILFTGVGVIAGIMAALMRGHHGGFVNVYMHLHWMVAMGFTLGLLMLRDSTKTVPAWVFVTAAISAQLMLQIGELDPKRYKPTAKDRAEGDRIVEALRDMPGPVLSPFAPWIAYQAGHEPTWALISLWDINHKNGPFRGAVKDVERAIEEGHYGTIVDTDPTMGHGARKYYEVAVEFNEHKRAFMPRTGYRRRPSVFLTYKE